VEFFLTFKGPHAVDEMGLGIFDYNMWFIICTVMRLSGVGQCIEIIIDYLKSKLNILEAFMDDP